MKKHLLSTSAIALGIAMASPAAAQQWDVKFGGFMKAHVGATDVDLPSGDNRDFDGVDVFTDGEIQFKPSITLDNGLTFGAQVELESANVGNQIDEQYVYIEGDTLGKFIIGNENSAGYLSMVGAPVVTSIWINSPSSSAFIPRTGTFNFRQAAISSYTEVAGNNDVSRLTYFTPSFNGLTVGVSYAASGTISTGNRGGFSNFGVDRDAEGEVTDIFDIGANYTQSFGGVDLTLAGRWGTGDRNAITARAGRDSNFDAATGEFTDGRSAREAVESGDPTTWGLGATVTFNNLTIGGSYTENDNDISGGEGDAQGFTLGAVYDIAGPWAVEALTVQGETENGRGVKDDEYEAYRVGAAREIGPGVKWEVYYIYSESKNGANGNKIEGNLLGTGVQLNF